MKVLTLLFFIIQTTPLLGRSGPHPSELRKSNAIAYTPESLHCALYKLASSEDQQLVCDLAPQSFGISAPSSKMKTVSPTIIINIILFKKKINQPIGLTFRNGPMDSFLGHSVPFLCLCCRQLHVCRLHQQQIRD